METARKLDKESFEVESIRAWLIDYVARVLELDPATVDPEEQFQSFGLDSASTVGLAGDLSEWLGKKIDPSLAYDYPTIDSLALKLAES